MVQPEAHVGVGGEVKDELAARHGGGQGGQVEVVAPHEAVVRVFERALDEGRLAGGEVVPADDLVALAEQTIRQRAADETGRARDEVFHRENPASEPEEERHITAEGPRRAKWKVARLGTGLGGALTQRRRDKEGRREEGGKGSGTILISGDCDPGECVG